MDRSSGLAAGEPRSAFIPLAGQFGRTLKRLREARRWSTRKLEEETGIGHSVLNRYENGPEPNPSLAHLIELEKVFDLGSLEDLFGEITVSYPTRRTLDEYRRTDG